MIEVVAHPSPKSGIPSIEFDILNADKMEQYMQGICVEKRWCKMTRDSYKMQHSVFRGVPYHLLEMKASPYDAKERLLWQELAKLNDIEHTWLAINTERNGMRETIVLYGERIKDKFDIVRVQGIQLRKLDAPKLVACGVGALATGTVLGFLSSASFGVPAAAAVAIGCSCKAAYDKQVPLPDAVYGYIFKTLQKEKNITIKNGRIIF